ncbi:DUF2927 domain-containing protein [Stappia indica]|uniref:DUF2927 domain-containing protein n=1 Tax=Stappia indica TaxID=538381 RepID=UPI001CD65DDF|nr:DUF2927 domain-containing protein [Stappia indica]MCA1297701.1 DUF2927 domain-containing protein [Stappia indica]
MRRFKSPFASLIACAFLLMSVLLTGQARAAPYTFSTEELVNGFMKTVFGLEYRSWSWQPYLVKKYVGPVRFYVHNLARKNRRPMVYGFIKTIGRDIHGLSTMVVASPEEANFIVYVVDRDQYDDVVRRYIYKDPKADVPGRCLVRVASDSRGISRSTAVIVSDEGNFLFRRCLVEELLQGLGPMNDDPDLAHSVFNDRSRHSRFTAFDKYILNMLYHRRIKPGMRPKEVEPMLPSIVREIRPLVR